MSESKFNIRIAELKDIPALMLMVPSYMQEAEKRDMAEAEKDSIRSIFLQSLISGSVTVLIAETKKKHHKTVEIGYGVFDLRPDIFGNLIAWGHHLYVKPEYRSPQLTDLIVMTAERFAAAAGASEFYIDTPVPKLFIGRRGYRNKYTVVSKRLEAVDVE